MSCFENENQLLARSAQRESIGLDLAVINLAEEESGDVIQKQIDLNSTVSTLNHPGNEAQQQIENLLREGRCDDAVVSLLNSCSSTQAQTARFLQCLSQENLATIISKLEQYCASTPSAQLCELILLAEPGNEFAWTVKINILIHDNLFIDVINQSSWALDACSRGAVVFLLQRGLAYVMTAQEQHALKDYLKALETDFSKTLSFVQTSQKMFTQPLCELFNKYIVDLNSTHKSHDDVRRVINIYKLILTLRPNSEVYYACAQAEKNLGNLRQAVETLTECVSQSNDNKTEVCLLLERAECLLRLGEIPRAVEDYTEAVKTDEEFTKMVMGGLPQKEMLNLSCHLEQNARKLFGGITRRKSLLTKLTPENPDGETNLKRACNLYRLLILIQPHHRDYIFNCAETYRLLGEDSKAIALYSFLLEHGHSFIKIFCARATCYINTSDFPSALADCEAALKQRPQSPYMLCCRGRCYILCGDWSNGLADFIHASQLDLSTVVEETALFSELDVCALKQRLETKAQELMSTREISGETSKELIALGELLTNIGSTKDTHSYSVYADILVTLKKYDEAQAVIVRLVKETPDDFLPLAHLASLRLKVGRILSAVETYFQIFQTFGEERLRACVSHLSCSDMTKIARESYVHGLKLLKENNASSIIIEYMSLAITVSDGRMFSALLTRAECRAHDKNFAAAVDDFNRALAIKPKSVEALCGRGLMFLVQGSLRHANQDFITAVHAHAQATHQVLKTIPQGMRQTIHQMLEAHAQKMFTSCSKNGLESFLEPTDIMTCGEGILLLCKFLVNESPRDASHHSILADAYIVHAQYADAAEELVIASSLNDTDVSVIARSGLVLIKLGNYEAAATEFEKLSESDVSGLLFTLEALNSQQRYLIAQESLNKAQMHTQTGAHKLALPSYSLAAAATSFQHSDILRSRSTCLQKLQLYTRAIADITTILSIGKPKITDLCARAFLFILDDNESAACNDYIEAMATDEVVAMEILTLSPGKMNVLEAFKHAAHVMSRDKRFDELYKICEFGLRLDSSDKELRKMKSKAEIYMNKCSIQ